jgi:hypothetical protein
MPSHDDTASLTLALLRQLLLERVSCDLTE